MGDRARKACPRELLDKQTLQLWGGPATRQLHCAALHSQGRNLWSAHSRKTMPASTQGGSTLALPPCAGRCCATGFWQGWRDPVAATPLVPSTHRPTPKPPPPCPATPPTPTPPAACPAAGAPRPRAAACASGRGRPQRSRSWARPPPGPAWCSRRRCARCPARPAGRGGEGSEGCEGGRRRCSGAASTAGSGTHVAVTWSVASMLGGSWQVSWQRCRAALPCCCPQGTPSRPLAPSDLVGTEAEAAERAACQGVRHVRRLLLASERVLPHLEAGAGRGRRRAGHEVAHPFWAVSASRAGPASTGYALCGLGSAPASAQPPENLPTPSAAPGCTSCTNTHFPPQGPTCTLRP